jgi:hypothetical protein
MFDDIEGSKSTEPKNTKVKEEPALEVVLRYLPRVKDKHALLKMSSSKGH